MPPHLGVASQEGQGRIVSSYMHNLGAPVDNLVVKGAKSGHPCTLESRLSVLSCPTRGRPRHTQDNSAFGCHLHTVGPDLPSATPGGSRTSVVHRHSAKQGQRPILGVVACSDQARGLAPRDGLEASPGQHVHTSPFLNNKLCGSLVEEVDLGITDKIRMRTRKVVSGCGVTGLPSLFFFSAFFALAGRVCCPERPPFSGVSPEEHIKVLLEGGGGQMILREYKIVFPLIREPTL